MSVQIRQARKTVAEVLERVGAFAYRLALLPSLSSVRVVFHVSMLRKYSPYLTHVVD